MTIRADEGHVILLLVVAGVVLVLRGLPDLAGLVVGEVYDLFRQYIQAIVLWDFSQAMR